jgi:ketosteroid isomerase-like protein
VTTEEGSNAIVTIHDDIEQFNDRFSTALAEGAFEVIAEMYADDAQFLSAGSPSVRGRDAIIRMMKERHASGPTYLTVESGDVWSSGDLVVDVGTFTIDGKPAIRGRELVVYRRNAHGALELLIDVPISDASA